MRRFGLRVRVGLLALVTLLPFLLLPRTQATVVTRWEPHVGGSFRQRVTWHWMDAWGRLAIHGARVFLSLEPDAVSSMILRPTAILRQGGGPREFRMDTLGRVTHLRLQHAGLDSLDRLNGFADLTSLDELDLSHNPLTSPLDLSHLSRLQRLDLSHSRTTVVRPLPATLIAFAMTDAGLTTIDRLERFPSLKALEFLDLSSNPLQGELQLQDYFRSLGELTIARTRIARVIAHVPRLRMLDASDTPLEALPSVRCLDIAILARTAVRDLRPMSRCTEPGVLVLDGMDVSRIEGLERLDLLVLSLRDAHGVDLRRLAGMKHLQILDLSGTDATDLSPLAELPLLWLNLSRTQAQLHSLRSQATIRSVDVRGTPFTKADVVRALGRPVQVFDDGRELSLHPRLWSARERVVAMIAFVVGLLGSVLLAFARIARPRSARVHGLLRVAAPICGGVAILATFGLGISFTLFEVDPLMIRLLAIMGVVLLVIVPVARTLLAARWLGASRAGPAVRIGLGPAMLIAVFVPIGAVIVPILLAAWRASRFAKILVALETILLLMLTIGLIYVSIVTASMWYWRRRRLVQSLRGERAEPAPLVVSCHSLEVLDLLRLPALWSESSLARVVACDPTMLGHSTVAVAATSTFPGVVVILPNGRPPYEWEVANLRTWLAALVERTYTPVWIIGSGVGSTREMRGDQAWVESMLRYVDGIEHAVVDRFAAVVYALPPAIEETLAANRLVANASVPGLAVILETAPTPVAGSIRRIFGRPSLPDRLDLLVRAAETALLVLGAVLAEHSRHDTSPRGRSLARTRARTVQRPSFGQWETLLRAGMRVSDTPFAAQISTALRAPAPPAALELARQLEAVSQGATRRIRSTLPDGLSRWHVVTLLGVLRNVSTAHGPITQRVDSALYQQALIAGVDLLAALPWPLVSLHSIVGVHRGCRTADAIERDADDSVRARVAAEDGQTAEVTLHEYISLVPGSGDLAVCAGGGQFVDPLSGIRLTARRAAVA